MSPSVPAVILNNGIKLPQIGFGTGMIRGKEMKEVIKTAIDIGYRHLDTAKKYENEDIVGEAVREKIAEGVIKREDVFITSKVWISDHHPDKIIPACQKTIKTLGLDYVDLYLLHWPLAINRDLGINDEPVEEDFDNTPLEQKWEKMEECVKLGLAKSIGISNFNSEQIEAILKVAKIKPVTNQVECHPYLNQKKLIAFCKERGITVTAYSPLGSPARPKNVSGVFTEIPIPNILEDPVVKKIAEKHKKTPGQIVLRYITQLGAIVIPKSANPQRMKDNLSIFNFTLSDNEVTEMDSLNKGLRLLMFQMFRNHKYYPFNIEY